MADVNITIGIDKDTALADVSRVTKDIEVQMSSMGHGAIEAGNQVGGLEKGLNRLASSRAPNLLSQVNYQLIQQIPLFKDNAAAASLANTAMYSLNSTLASLVGPAGLILTGVSVLTLMAIAFKKKKEAVDESSKALEENQQRLRDFNGFVSDYTGALLQIATTQKDVFGEAAKRALQNTTSEIKTKIEAEKDDIIALTEKIKLERAVFEAMIPTSTGYGEQRSLVENLVKAESVHTITLAQLLSQLDKIEGAFNKLKQPMFDVQAQFDAFSESIGGSWMMSMPADNPMLKQARVFHDQWQEMIMNLIQVQKETEAENKLIEEGKRKLEQAATAGRQSFLSMTSSIQGAFTDLFSGIEVQWSKLIQRMAAEMVVSSIFKLVSLALFPVPALQEGTAYVPQAGPYMLHKGERVMTAEENHFYRTTNNKYMGGNTIIINNYGSEGQDRKQLVKDLRETLEFRELNL